MPFKKHLKFSKKEWLMFTLISLGSMCLVVVGGIFIMFVSLVLIGIFQ